MINPDTKFLVRKHQNRVYPNGALELLLPNCLHSLTWNPS